MTFENSGDPSYLRSAHLHRAISVLNGWPKDCRAIAFQCLASRSRVGNGAAGGNVGTLTQHGEIAVCCFGGVLDRDGERDICPSRQWAGHAGRQGRASCGAGRECW
ncbi:hypothetical protein RSal33209_3369 [Renibacterium salmoninarum ATCC 33209]|uniref:Uncharacterized protein n=1 Tax=Renibacterium salmoninarum (strain ATCC 33209 / DSM 20767 / JCM 11484 / NBRC 15589 / NCIMB 2235) TaxID=288705 RepID=A9WV58_RENSM|nr:hypothetical protein RSal33209_3369 [Renibacterium salmoninarum ATCC 33209]